MKLESFREILIKKASGNSYLQTLIEYAKDDLIADCVLESLQKMAEPSAAMGRGANHAVTSYAAGLKPVHVEQLRDSLGHHISHYRGALKAMHSTEDKAQKAKLRGIADQHLNKIVPLMHLAGRASKHSGGNLVLDYPTTTPWETNYTTTERLPNGKLKEGTKDLGRRPSLHANRQKNPRAVPDYRYLEMPPHPGHAMTEKMPFKGGYPFEEVQLGTPQKRDSGQAYLPIEDAGDVSEYVPHPFDKHPVHEYADYPQHQLTPEHHSKINEGLTRWSDSEHHKQWLADQKAKYAKDPEAYKKRGLSKPEHVFKDIPLNKMPHHEAADMLAPPETKVARSAEQPASKKDMLSKPQSKSQDDVAREAWNTLDDGQKKALGHLFPDHIKGTK